MKALFASLTERDFTTQKSRREYRAQTHMRLTALAKCVWDEVHYALPRNERAIALWLQEMNTITASRRRMSD